MNSSYQLGYNTATTRTSPVIIDSGTNYSEVIAGQYFTCGITAAGVLKCWGANATGQLGDGTTVNKPTPTVIDSGVNFSKIFTNSYSNNVCGITTAGVLKCWGENSSYQLANNSNSYSNVPIVIDSGVVYNTLSISTWTICGLTNTGLTKCWGDVATGKTIDKQYTSVPRYLPILRQ